MRTFAMVAVLVAVLTSGAAARQWETKSGNKVEAQYVSATDTTVRLYVPSAELTVDKAIDTFVDADQQFIRQRLAETRKDEPKAEEEEPADQYTQAIRKDPTNPRPYYDRGLASLNRLKREKPKDDGAVEALQAQYDAAIVDFQKSLELDPKSAVYHDGLGQAYAGKGDPVTAHEEYNKAIELDEELPSAFRHRGENMRALSKTSDGKILMDEARESYRDKHHHKRMNTLGKAPWQPLNSTTGNVSRGGTVMQLAKFDFERAKELEERYRGGRAGWGGYGGPGGPGGPGGSGCKCPNGGSGPGCACPPNCANCKNCTAGCGCGSCGGSGGGPGAGAGPGPGPGPGPGETPEPKGPLAVYPEKAEQGQMITLVANPSELAKGMPAKVTAKTGPAAGIKPKKGEKTDVDTVEFYADINGNGELDEEDDKLVGIDSDATDGFTATVPSSDLPPGDQTYFALPKGTPLPPGEAGGEGLLPAEMLDLAEMLEQAAAQEYDLAKTAEQAGAGEGLSTEQAKELGQEQDQVASVADDVAEKVKEALPKIAEQLKKDAGKPIDEVADQVESAEDNPGEPSKPAAEKAAEEAKVAAEELALAADQLRKAAKKAQEAAEEAASGQPAEPECPCGQVASATGEIIPAAGSGEGSGPGEGSGAGPGSGGGAGGSGDGVGGGGVAIGDDDVDEVIERALGYIEDDDYDEAIGEYDRLVEHDPNNAYYLRNRAGAYLATGGYGYAIRDYDRLITLDARNADLYYNRGCAYLAAGQLDQALADFSMSIRLNETWGLAYNNRGTTYARKGDYAKAVADFNAAIEIDPSDGVAYRNRALAYKKLGQTQKAEVDFAKFRELGSE